LPDKSRFQCRAASQELPFDFKKLENNALNPKQTRNPKQELPFDFKKLENNALNPKQTLNPKQELPFDTKKLEKRKKAAKAANEADDFGLKAMSLSSNSLFGGGTH
jgi:predicted nucleotidyltransferase